MASYNKLLTLVKEHLDPDEKIEASVGGTYECKIMGNDSVRSGLFVATEKRIVFYAKKLTGYDLESFPLENISSIEAGKNLMGNTITFYASGNKASMKWINFGNVKEFMDYVRNNMGKKSHVSSETKTESIPDQIKKLSELKDQGILTEEEFNSKKKELLAKM